VFVCGKFVHYSLKIEVKPLFKGRLMNILTSIRLSGNKRIYEKHSSLFVHRVSNKEKSFKTLNTCINVIKNFFVTGSLS
jgi:hypothetical protein